MKSYATIFLALLVAALPIAEARDGGGRGKSGGGGGSRPSSRPSNSGSVVKRSPSTGSKISRPTPKPAPRPATRPSPSKPASKPAPKPAARPENKPASRPAPERPTTRPAPGPNTPGNGNNRPDGGGNNRPGNGDNRPGTGNNRPGNNTNRPGNGDNRPGTGDNRPGNNTNRPGNGNNRPGENNNRPGNGSNRPGDNSNRPGDGNNRPGDNNNRPGNGNNLPGTGNNRPGNNNNNRPGNANNRPGDGRPNLNRPNNNRPGTLPGMVTYPDRPHNNRPGSGNGNNNDRFSNNKNNNNRYNNVHIDKVNVNRKNNGLNRPGSFPNNKHNWDNKKWGGNNGIWGNNNNVNINNNVKINNNFRNNYNYAYRPNYWGSRPWWGAGSSHTWHHGHWNYGYNSRWYSNHYYYNDNDFATGVMWGIGVWSLGNLIYDMGYQSYRNPYPAPPVQSESSKSTIVYNQPISVTAAEYPPGDEEVAKIAETKSDEALERSRAAFKQGDYVKALKSNEEAIGHTPGDTTLHEYRALCLFALGKYGDAAGVLNPVLASGPGWGWDTMVDFYQSSTVYDEQLRKLEAYVKGRPDAADGHFLLGYHYLVCGHTEKAYEQFKTTTELQPADSIARQLRDLMKDSLPDDGASDAEAPLPPPPIPSEKLVGTWVNATPDGGKITFKMEESGDFLWTYTLGEKTSELKGTYGLDAQGLLVLTTDDSQMISNITLPQDSELKFVLVGSPTGDPGLDFKKS